MLLAPRLFPDDLLGRFRHALRFRYSDCQRDDVDKGSEDHQTMVDLDHEQTSFSGPCLSPEECRETGPASHALQSLSLLAT